MAWSGTWPQTAGELRQEEASSPAKWHPQNSTRQSLMAQENGGRDSGPLGFEAWPTLQGGKTAGTERGMQALPAPGVTRQNSPCTLRQMQWPRTIGDYPCSADSQNQFAMAAAAVTRLAQPALRTMLRVATRGAASGTALRVACSVQPVSVPLARQSAPAPHRRTVPPPRA